MVTQYHFTIRGHLDAQWADWFDGLTITNRPDGDAVLSGPIADQAALHGVLAKLRDYGLPLISVQPAEQSEITSGKPIVRPTKEIGL